LSENFASSLKEQGFDRADRAPAVSIIVCTHNRRDALAECLRSLLADGSSVERELVVVDNASADGTSALVVDLSQAGGETPVRYLFEPRLGKSHALNSAVTTARGGLLLFTDDDATVEDGWADALVEPFDDPHVGAVGGRILAQWPYPPPRWLTGDLGVALGLPDFGDEPRVFGESETPLGVNMAVRAELTKRVATPFDVTIGHRGARYMGHEEVLFLERVRKTHLLVYAPSAGVKHHVLPEKMEFPQVRGSFFRAGFGLARADRLLGHPSPSLPRRVVRAARTCRGALEIRRRNSRMSSLGPDDAYRECRAFMWAGKHLEMVFGRFPRVTDWMAGHLA
jgi:GT2 family glycosyltransferase